MNNNDVYIQKAIAKNLVRDTPKTLALIRKYQPVNDNISYFDLLTVINNLIAKNKNFEQDYTLLIIGNKAFHNDDGAGSTIGGIISGVVSGGATVLGTAMDLFGGGEGYEAAMKSQQVVAKNAQMMMAMVQREEDAVENEKKQKNMLLIAAIAAMVIFTGFIIYIKK